MAFCARWFPHAEISSRHSGYEQQDRGIGPRLKQKSSFHGALRLWLIIPVPASNNERSQVELPEFGSDSIRSLDIRFADPNPIKGFVRRKSLDGNAWVTFLQLFLQLVSLVRVLEGPDLHGERGGRRRRFDRFRLFRHL